MRRAFGIVDFSPSRIRVRGLQDYRPIGAFSFLGRYRIIDFPISNMTNSEIEHIQVYVKRRPRSLVEHLGTGRHYNINSKSGRLRVLYAEDGLDDNNIYNTDIGTFIANMECIEKENLPYVVIAPSYMIYAENYDKLIQTHINSGADITLLYHTVDNADVAYPNCMYVNLNKQKGVLSIERNRGTAKNRNIFMDTYVMKKELFIELVYKAHQTSSMYSLVDIVNASCNDYDVRAISHRGYFAAINDLKSYYDANLSLLDLKVSEQLFNDEWPIYTRTSDSQPTKYLSDAAVKDSFVSNGCTIEGEIHHSIIGRGCVIKKGAVVEDSVLLPGTLVGENAVVKGFVVDKGAQIVHENELNATPEDPGYVKRRDVL